MKKLTTKDISIMGISLALMFIFGKGLYLLSRFFPIPGSRIFTTTPLFTFILTGAVLKTKKIGTVSIITGLLGLLLFRFSIYGGIAVGLAGFLADFITFIIFRKYTDFKSIYLSVPLNSSISVWTSFFIVNIFVPDSKFVQVAGLLTLLVSVLVYGLSLLCSISTIKIFKRRKLIDEDTYSLL